jgi:hypothetical protein
MVQTRHQKHDYPSDEAASSDEPSTKQAKVDDRESGAQGENPPKEPKKRGGGNRKQSVESDEEEDNEDERENTTQKGQTAGDKDAETAEARENYGISIEVNRAPVFMLWGTVVSERLGYSTEESYTYADWLAKELFQVKGRELGQEKKDAASRVQGDNTEDDGDTEYVNVFGGMKIPIGVDDDGKRLAMKGKKMLDPTHIRHFVEHKFGVNLAAARNNMRGLADSLPPEELRGRAYELYEKFRPEWKGWGKTGTLDILAIDELANDKNK